MVAGERLIKKRIGSVRNTSKITRTMEMVSTAKSKKLVDKIRKASPYKQKLLQTLSELQQEDVRVESPYLQGEEDLKLKGDNALVVVTANRGLCGGYNSSVLKVALLRYNEICSSGKKCSLYVIGKKGISFFQFLNLPIQQGIIDIDDKMDYRKAQNFIYQLMRYFEDGLYSQVDIISTIYHSAASQTAELQRLLPLDISLLQSSSSQRSSSQKNILEEEVDEDTGKDISLKKIYAFEPDPDTLLKQMIPLAVETHFYGLLLDALASEQIYRRVAMKNATDAGEEMLKLLVRDYNRARQASITQELSEIVAGADAV